MNGISPPLPRASLCRALTGTTHPVLHDFLFLPHSLWTLGWLSSSVAWYVVYRVNEWHGLPALVPSSLGLLLCFSLMGMNGMAPLPPPSLSWFLVVFLFNVTE